MKIKGITALLLVVIMLFSFAGCDNTKDKTTLTIDGENVTPGQYRVQLLTEYLIAYNQLESTKDLWNQKVEEKPFADYVHEKAVEACKQFIAIERKFDELNLSLNASETSAMQQQLIYYWTYYNYKSIFEKNGVGETTYYNTIVNDTKYSKLFEYYYISENGPKKVSQEDADKHISDNYMSFKTIFISVLDKDNKKLSGESYAEALSTMEAYLTRAKNGEDFNKIIDEYNKAAAEKNNTTYDSSDYTESDYWITIKNDSTSLTDKAKEALKAAGDKEFILVDDDVNIYVFQKLDPLSSEDEEYKESLFKTAVSDLKGKEFEQEVASWAKDYSVTENTASIKKYSVKKLKVS